MIPELLYVLILDLPFTHELAGGVRATRIEAVPKALRDIVQMFQKMNPELEADVREEMKAALVALLMEK